MSGPIASLNTVWFAVLGFLWTGYFVLEGFDFGVGVLSLVLGRDDIDRRMARTAIGPWWDGNEVWLIVAAGATFAAFPVWYASMFSGFYLALFVVLVALIVRGVSFEFRGKRDGARWRAGWDWALAVGSLIPAFAWGVAFTDLVHGLPLSRSGLYLGSFWGLLAPVAVVGGLASLAMFLTHGAVFLNLKTTGPLAVRAPPGRHVALLAGRRAGGRHRGLAGRTGLARPGRSARRSTARAGRRVRAGLHWVRAADLGRPGGRRVRAQRAGHRRGQCRSVHRAVPPGHGVHRPGTVADHLGRRLSQPDPDRDDHRRSHLRPARAGLSGLELLGVPAAADPARRVRQPVLLIAGERDPQVIELNRRAMRQLPGNARLDIIRRIALFEEPRALEQVARLAREWLSQHLRPVPPANRH